MIVTLAMPSANRSTTSPLAGRWPPLSSTARAPRRRSAVAWPRASPRHRRWGAQQQFRFGQVGRDQRGQRHQARAQRIERVGLRAGARPRSTPSPDRARCARDGAVRAHPRRPRSPRRCQHAQLDRADVEVVEAGVDLRAQEVHSARSPPSRRACAARSARRSRSARARDARRRSSGRPGCRRRRRSRSRRWSGRQGAMWASGMSVMTTVCPPDRSPCDSRNSRCPSLPVSAAGQVQRAVSVMRTTATRPITPPSRKPQMISAHSHSRRWSTGMPRRRGPRMPRSVNIPLRCDVRTSAPL